MVAQFRALFRADTRNVVRDEMLKYLVAYPIVLGLLMRWLTPWVQQGLAATYDIAPLYPLLVSYFGIIVIPALGGMIIAFLILDERDMGTLTALAVTPMKPTTFFAYRMIVPIVLALVSIYIVIPLMNLMTIDWLALLPIGLLGAFLAPITALILVNYSANKVQGLAVMKGASLLLSLPFIAWFIAEPWQWLFGVLPSYWPVKAFWLHSAGEPWGWVVAVGFVVAGIWLYVLQRGFASRMRRY